MGRDHSDPCKEDRLALYAESHDTVDNIVVVLLESLDGLLAAHVGLSHDELDVLRLKTSVVDLLAIILFLLGLLVLDCLALALTICRVVVGGLIGRLCSKLLSCRCLSLRVEILNLSLAEDAAKRIVSILWSCVNFSARSTYIQVLLLGDLYTSGWLMTKRMFLGLRRVTRVMPSTCFKPSLAMALRAFFSFRLCTAT